MRSIFNNEKLIYNLIALNILNQMFIGDEGKVRESLKKYCEIDTLGMVIIWEELIKLKFLNGDY